MFFLTVKIQLNLAKNPISYGYRHLKYSSKTYSVGLMVAKKAACRRRSCWIWQPNWQPLVLGGRGYHPLRSGLNVTAVPALATDLHSWDTDLRRLFDGGEL